MLLKLVQWNARNKMANDKHKEGIILPHKTKATIPSDIYDDHDKQNKGLGDLVETIAQPIAKAIDKVAGTKIQQCGACKKRKEYLNKKFPTN